jgi:CheY-like chemotaxis protein
VSLRILFADDSVTAQNMGRKILTDAGYEVVAVSNGAAAVKKIAEQKPDIIILDVYMPGYSGLEVCEKVRGSVATLKTPVLLTVGKMEPYRAEETSRVRADGVIVKPFEASDLLAIVKKFEERIGQQPLEPEPAAVERFYEDAADELPAEHPEPAFATTQQATVDVPDHMATSSAFSDLLGGDSAHSMNNFAPPPPVVRETPPPVRETAPPPPPVRAPIPEYDVPMSWRERIEDKAESFSAAVSVPEDVSTAAPPETAARQPLQIPVYQEPQETPAPVEVVPTAMPPAGEMEVAREPELQESAAEVTRSTVADVREPDLMPTLHGENVQPAATETADTAEIEPVSEPAPAESAGIPAPSFAEALASAGGPAAEAPVVAPMASAEEVAPVFAETATTESPEIETETRRVSDSDFEARVAAAMSAYSGAPEHNPPTASAVAAPEVLQEPVKIADEIEPPPVVDAALAEVADTAARQTSEPQETFSPSYDYHPPAAYTAPTPRAESQTEAVAEPLPAAHEPAVAPAASVAVQPEPIAAVQQAVAASLEAAVPLAATAAAAGGEADHQHTIAQAVHRVMERLKPELVEEIMKELKPKQ